MNSTLSISLLLFIAAFSVIRSRAEQKINEAHSTLYNDKKGLAKFVFRGKRKKYLIANFIFFMIFAIALKYTHYYYVCFGIAVMIYSCVERTIYIKEMENEFSEMNFPSVYIKRINRVNRLFYVASILIGIIAMNLAAYYHYR